MSIEAELATRGERFRAALVDVLLCLMLVVAGGFILGLAGFGRRLAGLVCLAGYYILQGVLLTQQGQSVGKLAVGIRIVKLDSGENGGFTPNVLLRALLNGLIGAIPFLGLLYMLVDTLFIFRQDRRCVHDLMAGTVVIRTGTEKEVLPMPGEALPPGPAA